MNEPENDAWECPTCLQDYPLESDYECSTCGIPASQHIRATSLCRLLREAANRESILIVENEKLKKQLQELTK